MKQILTLILCMWVTAGLCNVHYHPVTTTASWPSASFRSTSTYTVHSTAYANTIHPTSYACSMSAISAANFSTLNSEGGACYQPTATQPGIRRISRPGDDDDDDEEGNLAIGEVIERSPVGDIPCLLVFLFAALYTIRRTRHLKIPSRNL